MRLNIIIQYTFTILLCSIGIYSTFLPTLISGFKLVQTNPGDTLFNAYILEHTYQYFFNKNYIAELWSPAFFYPYRNVLTYSVNLFGVAPFYWSFRMFFGWLLSYQLWMILMFILIFISFYFLMKSLKINPYIASFSAYIFAFNLPRIYQLDHQQLFAQFYTPLAFVFLLKFLKTPSIKILTLFLLFIYLQLIGDFYLGWFLILSLCIFIPITLFINNKTAHRLFIFLSRNVMSTIIIFIFWISIMLYSLYPYVKFSLTVIAVRPISEVVKMLPTIYSWIQSPPGSLWYRDFSRQIPEYIGEHNLFIGVYAILLIIFSFGLYLYKKIYVNKILILTCFITALILFIISFNIGNGISFWVQIYSVVPGAKAIRAVSRIELIIYFYLIFSAFIALDVIYKNFTNKKVFTFILTCILVLIITEQSIYNRSSFNPNIFNKEITFVNTSIKNCHVAYVRTDATDFRRRINIQLVAMFAGLQSSVPVINGYSGFFPYPLDKNLEVAYLKKIINKTPLKHLCIVNLN